MANQEELDHCYMEVAKAHASLSKGVRAQVGACLVTKNSVILGGCNGLAPGSSNNLEEKVYMDLGAGGWCDEDDILEYWPLVDEKGRYRLVTKPETIHGELNCLIKAAKEGVSVVDSTLYVTLSCCKTCSEMIAASGVKRVVYLDEYRDTSGIDNLIRLGVKVSKLD